MFYKLHIYVYLQAIENGGGGSTTPPQQHHQQSSSLSRDGSDGGLTSKHGSAKGSKQQRRRVTLLNLPSLVTPSSVGSGGGGDLVGASSPPIHPELDAVQVQKNLIIVKNIFRSQKTILNKSMKVNLCVLNLIYAF
jgi:hypothetical protein